MWNRSTLSSGNLVLVAAGSEELSSSPQTITIDVKTVGKWSKDKAVRLSRLIEPGVARDDQPGDVTAQAIAKALQS